MKNKLSINFKTILSYAFVMSIIVSGLIFPLVAKAVDTPTLTIGSQSASNGDTINVPINASNFANTVVSMDFTVQYDPTLLTYTGFTQNAISGHGTLNVGTGDNTVSINWFDSVVLNTDNGTIITLNFTVISASTTNANLTFTGTLELNDVNGNIINASFVDGVITLNPDEIAPVIAEVTPVTTPTNDTTPSYIFSSDEAGTISYGGSCTSGTTNAVVGSNPIAFSALTEGTYNNCTITVTDAASNASNVLPVTSFIIDTTKPTVGIVFTDTSLIVAETSLVTFTFNEAITGFTNDDLTIANGSLTAVTSQNDIIWTATFVPTDDLEDATNVITIDKTGVTDVAGNAGVGATDSNNYAIDTKEPTVVVTMDDYAFNVGDTAIVTFTFSESPTGFTADDLTIGSGIIGTINSTTSTAQIVTYTPTDDLEDATNVISVGIAWSDSAGNAPVAISNSSNYTVDTKEPTAGITYSIDHAVKDADTLVITATFSEVMGDSPTPKIAISYSGGISSLTATDMTRTDTTHYFYNLNVPDGNGTGTVTLSTGTDSAGNVLVSTPSSGATFTVDNIAPTNQDTVFGASVSKQGGQSVSIVSSGDANNNIWFAPSETTLFTAGDTMTTATGTATTILAPANEGSYGLFVIDIAENYSTSSVAVLTVDNTAPIIAEVTAIDTFTNDTTPSYTFSSDGVGTISYGGSCGNATSTNAVIGNNTITFSALAEGTYSDCTITVTDTASNASNILSIKSFTVDTTIPTAYLTGPVAGDRTELLIKFAEALHASTLAISDRSLLLHSAFNNVYTTSTPISIGSTTSTTVVWDNSDTDAPIATISIPSITFIEDGTVRINFVEGATKDLAGNVILSATNVDALVLTSTQIAAAPTVTVNTTQTEVVITSPNNTSVTVPSTVTNATLNINSLTTDDGTNVTATLPKIDLSVATDTFTTSITVAVPLGAIITAPTGWNGIINIPKIKANSSVTVTPDSGKSVTVSSVVEIGSDDTALTFSEAVRILIPDATGKYAGYSRDGVFVAITTTCDTDTQIAGNSLAASGDCKIDVGSDLVIWTKHFTKFITYTQSTISSGGGGGGGGSAPPVGPTNLSLNVNLGAKIAHKRQVTLYISGYPVSEMIMSEDPTFADTNWQEFKENIYFILSIGNGNKIIYVKLRDDKLNESSLMSVSIDLEISELLEEIEEEKTIPELFSSPVSNGMLIRKQGTYGVYLIDNNRKRAIRSAEIFLGRGYKWGDIVEVEQSVLDLYALGEDITLSEDITTALRTITINTPRLRVRSLAGLEGEIITLVSEGQEYSILAEQNGWYKINYESGKTGWVMSMYTTSSDSSAVSSINITINTPRLRVRNLASLEGKIITIVLEGQEYSVLSQQDGWYQINYETGKTGWVMSRYTK